MMDFWNLIKFIIFQVFVGFVLFHFIACDCLFPDQDFPNGKIKYISPEDINKTHAGDMYVLQFICSPGYDRIGSKFIQCVDDEWTDEVPICAIMECPFPPNIQNAKYVLKTGVNNAPTLGSSAIYSCKAGYELNDTDTHSLRCVLGPNSRRAQWSGEKPICQEKNSCPDPGVSKHGSRQGKCCLSGNTLLFSCNDGYELVGKEMIQCLRTGEWSSRRPLCRPLQDHCDLPPPIHHGVVIGEKDGDYFVPDEEAQILCEPGFTPKGLEFILCDEGGVWEAEFEECTEIFCDPPPSVARVTIPELVTTNLTSFPYNFGITYVCDEGYRLMDGDGWRMCGKRGWTGKNPSCEVIQCADPGTPENGKKIGDDYSVGSKVQFACFNGYDLLGSIERFCLPNGQWTGELSRCDLPSNYCPNPGVPVKGSKNSTSYDLGAQIRFYCEPGYIQIGSEVRYCLEDHTWSGTDTKCLGPYDFDNEAQVRDILQAKLTQKAEEQRQELQNYQKAVFESWLNGSVPVGRMLDLNFPGRLILYFAFDVSGSIGPHNFAKSIQFAKAVVRKVGISENGARAGAVTFSSDAEDMFLPLNFNTTEGVLNALDKINYTGGGTAASSAFSMIRKDYMPLVDKHLGYKNIKSVIFLITDGKANMGGSPKEEAQILKKAGVEIYCIGITGDPRKKTLYDLATTSKSANGEYPNVYILQDYAALSWLIQEITNGTVDYSQCGLGLENVNVNRGRILGGEKSKDPWPWMAALYMKSKTSRVEIFPDYALMCGASIIHRHFILTAAHCMFVGMEQRNKKDIIIKLGLTDIQNQTYVQESEVLKIHIHPKYRPGPLYDYDIALLQMERPIEYNAFIRPVCLPPKELPENTLLYSPTALAWATGWGYDGVVQKGSDFREHKVSLTRELKEIPLRIQSRDRCQQSMKDNGLNISYFTDHMFCAGSGQGGNDTCQGDSGGPLMQSLVNAEGYLYWTQVGIVSWGIGCGLENTYGYYSHVYKLRQWIDETIENATKKM